MALANAKLVVEDCANKVRVIDFGRQPLDILKLKLTLVSLCPLKKPTLVIELCYLEIIQIDVFFKN